MKKILIINGGIRKGGQTSRVVNLFKDKFSHAYEFEIINLNQTNFKFCIGCSVCLSRGEEFCPNKDDRDLLLEKMDGSDVIIFTTPNYSLSMTHLMKNFFDRFAFVYHRPRFFGKVFSSIVTQGVYGGKEISKYFKETAGFWGGIYVPGTVLTMPAGAYNPSIAWKKEDEERIHKELEGIMKRIRCAHKRNLFPRPSLFKLIIFRMSRTSHKYNQEDNRDFHYFTVKGWFDSPYYYYVSLGLIKSVIGALADLLAKKLVTSAKQKEQTGK